MRILSFDQSTLMTGWAVFDDGNYLCHGLIDLHKMKQASERFAEMCDQIRATVQEYHPDIVVIEDVMLMRSPQTMKILAELLGVIMGICRSMDIQHCVYLPTEWRKILGFRQGRIPRQELKAQAIQLVLDQYGLSVKTDEADAICIAMAHIKKMEETQNENEQS